MGLLGGFSKSGWLFGPAGKLPGYEGTVVIPVKDYSLPKQNMEVPKTIIRSPYTPHVLSTLRGPYFFNLSPNLQALTNTLGMSLSFYNTAYGLGFRGLGFRGSGFRGSGFRVSGYRGSGLRVYACILLDSPEAST